MAQNQELREARQLSGEVMWLRIRRAAEELVGKRVELYLSTAVPPDLKGVVEDEGNVVYIVLNMTYSKEIDNILDIVAHELAHVKTRKLEHDATFNAAYTELREELRRRYFQQGRD